MKRILSVGAAYKVPWKESLPICLCAYGAFWRFAFLQRVFRSIGLDAAFLTNEVSFCVSLSIELRASRVRVFSVWAFVKVSSVSKRLF